jgi:hypothetical protein
VAPGSDSRIQSARARSVWSASARYGLALAIVGLIAGAIHVLKALGIEDARPALLVGVAAGALYGGLGPGLAGLALSLLIDPDPVIGLTGAGLVAICIVFRQARSTPEPDASVRPDHASDSEELSHEFEAAPALSPRFGEVTTEATWRFHHEQPLDITLPEDEQVEHLYLYSVLAECNDAFARMYGFRSAAEVVGTRLVVFLPPSNPENVAYLRSFIRSGYRLEDAQSHEIDRYGNSKFFINNLVGIFERGELVGAWGTQRDVTGTRGTGGSQEYRPRLHSTKSSSQ